MNRYLRKGIRSVKKSVYKGKSEQSKDCKEGDEVNKDEMSIRTGEESKEDGGEKKLNLQDKVEAKITERIR